MPAQIFGRLAQWLEYCVHIAGVIGSNPIPSTIQRFRRGKLEPWSQACPVPSEALAEDWCGVRILFCPHPKFRKTSSRGRRFDSSSSHYSGIILKMIAFFQNILIQYLIWYFWEVPGKILEALRNFLLFNMNYFSIPLLFKTLFSHWRRYRWSYKGGFSPARYIEVYFSNLISRILGAIVRTVLILLGLLVEIFILLGGIIVFLGWLFLPLLMGWGLYFGFRQVLM